MPESEAFKETELDDQFTQISSSIEEAHRLRSEGKISDSELAERLEEGKIELEALIAKSKVALKPSRFSEQEQPTYSPLFQKEPNVNKKVNRRKL